MKTLSILRHAKAQPSEERLVDFERILTERGVKDTRLVAKVLEQSDTPVEWVISSPAARARQTTEITIAVLDFKRPLLWQEKIYEATPETLLTLLTEIPSGIEHALLVGHNPGLEFLVAGLCNGGPTHLHLHLAPATLAMIELEIFSWDQIRWGCGHLHLLLPPKVLRK